MAKIRNLCMASADVEKGERKFFVTFEGGDPGNSAAAVTARVRNHAVPETGAAWSPERPNLRLAGKTTRKVAATVVEVTCRYEESAPPAPPAAPADEAPK